MIRMRNVYATLEHDTGMDYRAIAERLHDEGDPMGHSTVRNIVIRVLERFATAIMASYGANGDPGMIARNPDFQRGIAALIHDAEGII